MCCAHWTVFIVQVTVKDIPSRVDSLTEDQKSLQKSLSGLTTKGDGDVPQLRSAVSALSSQVYRTVCCHC